ncbi:TPA: hypothetical protein U2S12_001824 [Yersinia enterocolitica]|nr:hypothetical protein [Yersinia enterocolitica]
MYFVDNGSAVPVMPQVKPVYSVAPQFFTEGGNGTPPTYPGPDWFNIFQSELLNVLREAGINPDKANNTQLAAAMKKLFLSRANPFADIKADGVAAVATALANLGLGTAAKKDVGTGPGQVPDMSSFVSSFGQNGYFKLPGGLIIQWGQAVGSLATTVPVNFPIPFPNALMTTALALDLSAPSYATLQTQTSVGISVNTWDSSGARAALAIRYIALGY